MQRAFMATCILFTILLTCSLNLIAQRSEQKTNFQLDQSGRTGLLIFSAYYGLWLGSTPYIIWDIDGEIKGKEGSRLPVGPLISTPASVLTTSLLTKRRNISRAQTSIITLGAHLGTWQGIGWPAAADWEEKDAVAMGTLSGLLGLGSGILLSNKIYFSSGGATLTHSGLFWGAWFGLVLGDLADHKDNALLQDMLIGSNLLVLSNALIFRTTPIGWKEAWKINGSGATIGIIFGLGYLGVKAEAGEKIKGSELLRISGLGTLAGLILGFATTSFKDGAVYSNSSSNSSYFPETEKKFFCLPNITIRRDAEGENQFSTTFGFRLVF